MPGKRSLIASANSFASPRSGVEARLARASFGEQVEPQGPELAVQLLDELQLSGYPWNCASSVDPSSASVEASGDTACVTRSK